MNRNHHVFTCFTPTHAHPVQLSPGSVEQMFQELHGKRSEQGTYAQIFFSKCLETFTSRKAEAQAGREGEEDELEKKQTGFKPRPRKSKLVLMVFAKS